MTRTDIPQEVTDAEGKIEWSADYSAWGERQYALPLAPEEAAPSGTECALRFQGQYFDAETGLHYNTFRYYDPGCGRFISPDPINIEGGLNLYQYAPNAANWIDPLGWCPTIRGKIQKAGLPGRGRYRYMAPKRYKADQELPRGPNGGYLDRHGNEWVKGPYHGDKRLPHTHEWDVRLSPKGERQWNRHNSASNAQGGGHYINIRPDGQLSH
jgi:RHS repeat-associated protein